MNKLVKNLYKCIFEIILIYTILYINKNPTAETVGLNNL